METLDSGSISSGEQSYAGFWVRFAAHMLDLGVIGFFFFSAFRMMELQMIDTGNLKLFKWIHRYLHMDARDTLTALTSILFTWSYYAGMESSPLRATAGKWAVGAYVTDLEGNRITFGRATGRHFSKIISALILLIGYIMAGLTRRKQALHDQIAGCLVLRK
jgi:uncharacterized RDD family membrane protein YckC